MTMSRAFAWMGVLVIPAALWAMLNSARNDLLYLTRSVASQVRKAGDDPEAFSRFYIRLRFPDGNPDRQEAMFGRLWYALLDCEPEQVTYGDRSPIRAEDQKTHAHGEVIMKGRSRRRDEPVTLSIHWIQYRGSWYIDDFDESS